MNLQNHEQTIQYAYHNMQHVVSGMIIKNERIFLTQRNDNVPYSDLWEFPGGKVEPRETHDEALVREFHEEVGMKIKKVGQPFYIATVGHYLVHLYIVELLSSYFAPSNAVKGYGWFSLEEMAALERMPSMDFASIAKKYKEITGWNQQISHMIKRNKNGLLH